MAIISGRVGQPSHRANLGYASVCQCWNIHLTAKIVFPLGCTRLAISYYMKSRDSLSKNNVKSINSLISTLP